MKLLLKYFLVVVLLISNVNECLTKVWALENENNEVFLADEEVSADRVNGSIEGVMPTLAEDYRAWAQGDSRWGSMKIGSSGKTMSAIGCALVSLTKLAIQAGLKDPSNYNPGTLLSEMNSKNGFTSSGGLYWGTVSSCISGFTNKGELIANGTYNSSLCNEQFVGWLKQGYHLCVQVKNGGHWVAVDTNKTLATGKVYIMDSLRSGANADITLESRYSTYNRVHAYTGGSVNPDCKCSESYAGEYICSTSSSNLLIRSGHGSQFSIVGRIPKGATVTVTKANGEWAHVNYNGVSGYASMEYLQKQQQVTPKLRWWVSDKENGDPVTEGVVGNQYFICYRFYDQVTGKDLDEVKDYNFNIKLTFFNPDGTERASQSFGSDTASINSLLTVPGTYKAVIDVTGDFTGSRSQDLVIADNPKKVVTSSTSLQFNYGDKSSLSVWSSGYYNGSAYFDYSGGENLLNCSWGNQGSDGKYPLNINAKDIGSTTLVVSVKDSKTNKIIHSVNVNVTVKEAAVSSVSINQKPAKTKYEVGESLSTNELKILVKYENGSSREISSGFTIGKFDSSSSGIKNITVSYGGKSTSFDVEVKAPTLKALSVVSNPNKLEYFVGEKLDTTGLKLKAEFSDGSVKEISSGFNITGYDSTKVGKQRVNVSYDGLLTTFVVNVRELEVTKISLLNQPNQLIYTKGESLDLTGMKIRIHYNNNTSKDITTGFITSGYDSSKVGKQTVTVSYDGKSTSFEVTVKEAKLPETDANIKVSSVSGIRGNEAEVKISLENNPGVMSMTFEVQYDKKILQLIEVIDSGKLGAPVHSDNLNASPYQLTWANDLATQDFKVNDTIATLRFKILENAELGDTPIRVSYDVDNYDIVNVNLEPVLFNTIDGCVQVTNVICGDVNEDGKVNTLDRMVITRYLAKWTGYGEDSLNLRAADVNNDGKVNTLDRMIITRYLAKWTGYDSLPYK